MTVREDAGARRLALRLHTPHTGCWWCFTGVAGAGDVSFGAVP